jgi:hypothetical protein
MNAFVDYVSECVRLVVRKKNTAANPDNKDKLFPEVPGQPGARPRRSGCCGHDLRFDWGRIG